MKTYYKYGEKEKEYLRKKDPILGEFIDEIGHIEKRITPDFFHALVDSIISQQISAKAADTVFERFSNLTGEITPEVISRLTEEEIQKCGMSFRKASYIKGAAQAILEGHIVPSELEELDNPSVIKKLTSLRGIGIWTAEMLLIFSLNRPDIVSWHDLGIRGGMKKLYGYEELTKKRFTHHKNIYSPYGTVASLYLWRIWSTR